MLSEGVFPNLCPCCPLRCALPSTLHRGAGGSLSYAVAVRVHSSFFWRGLATYTLESSPRRISAASGELRARIARLLCLAHAYGCSCARSPPDGGGCVSTPGVAVSKRKRAKHRAHLGNSATRPSTGRALFQRRCSCRNLPHAYAGSCPECVHHCRVFATLLRCSCGNLPEPVPESAQTARTARAWR